MAEKLYTLEEAKELLKSELREELSKGARCPVCTQFSKMYKRPLYGTIAQDLIRLYRACEFDSNFYHIGEFSSRKASGGGDFAKLVYWGLVEEKEKDEDDTTTRTSGYWRITGKGELFVQGEITVPSHVKIYDGRCLGLTGEQVSIKDVLGDKFDYEELMNA